jgi:hypothetical protein
LKALQDHSLQDNKLRANLKSLWNSIKSLKTDDSRNNKISAEDLNDLFFIPEEEDIDINNLDYLIKDYREGDFKPNENFSGIFH